MRNPIVLRQGMLELALEPELGACCSALRYHGGAGGPVDVLVPLAPGNTDPFQSGCFVLVPYSNRLFGQRLLMPGSEALAIPLNRDKVSTPVHGVGWTKRWNVVSCSRESAVLAYHHAPDAYWPFAHECGLTVTLADSGAHFELTLRNLGGAAMPAGLGFHPYFALEPDALASFQAKSVWQQDADGVPNGMEAVAGNPRFDFSHPRPAQAVELNHCFAHWDGYAQVLRPHHALTVQLTAGPGLGHLVVYRPAAQPWLCMEPVSHATGAFSLKAMHSPENGVRYLASGASMVASMDIEVETDVATPSSRVCR